jgi:hypothetical protein
VAARQALTPSRAVQSDEVDRRHPDAAVTVRTAPAPCSTALSPDEFRHATLQPPTRARTCRVEVSSAAHEESRSGRVRVAVPPLRG